MVKVDKLLLPCQLQHDVDFFTSIGWVSGGGETRTRSAFAEFYENSGVNQFSYTPVAIYFYLYFMAIQYKLSKIFALRYLEFLREPEFCGANDTRTWYTQKTQ